jgi:hypothetical protein
MLVLGALLVAAPAAAQFGSIFNQPPPRPPADVPNAPPPFPPAGRGPPPFFPNREPAARSDEPPEEPQPAPMSLPPQNRPGAGGIQSQELPPPPGAQQAPRPPAQSPAAPLQPPQNAPQQPQQPANAAPAAPPQNEVVVEPPPQRITNPTAVFSGLDKITGRITSFDVAINETVQFGALQVTPRACYSRPPTETPQTDSFVEVDEVTLQGKIQRIFTGWMFAASPGLHAVEHPIYDVWLTDCKGGKMPAMAEMPDDQQAQQPKPAAKPQPQKRPPPRSQQQPGFLPALR